MQKFQANAFLCACRSRQCKFKQTNLLSSWSKRMDVCSIFRTLVWKSGDVVPIPVLVLTSLLKHSPQSHRSVGKQVIVMFFAYICPSVKWGWRHSLLFLFSLGIWLGGWDKVCGWASSSSMERCSRNTSWHMLFEGTGALPWCGRRSASHSPTHTCWIRALSSLPGKRHSASRRRTTAGIDTLK